MILLESKSLLKMIIDLPDGLGWFMIIFGIFCIFISRCFLWYINNPEKHNRNRNTKINISITHEKEPSPPNRYS